MCVGGGAAISVVGCAYRSSERFRATCSVHDVGIIGEKSLFPTRSKCLRKCSRL